MITPIKFNNEIVVEKFQNAKARAHQLLQVASELGQPSGPEEQEKFNEVRYII